MTPPDDAAGIAGMTPAELKDRMDREQPIVVLDVREEFERDIADLPDFGQRHIPLVQLPERVRELDSSAPTVVYCRTGSRSAWAVQFLKDQGFDSVWNLTGGVMAWREEIDPSLQSY